MAYYYPDRDTKLIVDGSSYGLSSMLTHFDPAAKQHRVKWYDSRSTTPLRPGMLKLKLKVLLCVLQLEETIYICMAVLAIQSVQTISHWFLFTVVTEQICPSEYKSTS